MRPSDALHMAKGLDLPAAAVTEPIGIFANRGQGKSSTAHRFVEQLYHAGLPSIVLDVKGDWYGIRSSADGKSAGLPFVIFGGDHADVPLSEHSGTQVGRFLAEQRVPAVIDLSGFSKTKARRWVMEFAEELYRVNRDPLMLVVDEADVLIPQRLSAEMMRLLGAMEDIAKRGRQRGLGILVVSQRIADVNKSVTDLLTTLFLFAISGTRTRKAVLDWIDDHADPAEAKAVVATLSSLQPGECWVWSPAWLRLLERVRMLRPDTFDSHATPEPGRTRTTIKTMADVDLGALSATLAESIERAKADDPRELRRRLADAERRVRELEARPAPEPETRVERVEVPVLDEQLVVRLEQALAPAAAVLSDVQDRLGWQVKQMGEVLAFERRLATPPPPAGRSARDVQVRAVAVRATPAPARPRPAAAVGRGGDLPEGERKILVALCQMGPLPRESLTIVTGYKRSTRDAYIQRLSTKGMVTVSADRRVAATEAGEDALGDFERLPTGAALRDWWLERLPDGESRILAVLMDAYPNPVARAELDDLGFKRSTRDAYLQRLTARQLVAGARGEVAAADVLFA